MSYLEQYEDAIYGCTTLRCGGCGTSCPGFTAEGFESNTPRGRMRIARGVLEGKLELTDVLVERVYFCNECGNCRLRCSFDPVDVIRALKAEIVKAGRAPREVHAKFESIKNHHNLCFAPHENRLDCLPEEMRAPREADVLFYLSCFAAYAVPSSVRATARILDEARVRWTTLGKEERCCGLAALQYGFLEKGEELVRHNVAAINNAAGNLGVSKMITSCPTCAACFKMLPQRFGLTLNVEVLHSTELFHQLIREGKLRFKEWNTTCVYHDSCYLGRWQGVYEEPRESLEAIPGVHLVEAEPNREFSQCCGSIPWWSTRPSSGVDERHVRLSERIARKRIQQIEETGADTCVVSCTGCLTLGRTIEGRRSKTKVMMISEALARSLISET